jgi:hypothetical protein
MVMTDKDRQRLNIPGICLDREKFNGQILQPKISKSAKSPKT